MGLFIETLPLDPLTYFARVLVIMFSICVHEYAHARVALRHGDQTAAWMGHLTLNPLVQMGVPSIVTLLIFGLAWGSVPVVVRNLKSRASAAWVAAAGPLANLALAAVFSGLAVASAGLEAPQATRFLILGAAANGMLCVFNLLPLPMLDGWAIFSLWFPGMQRVDPELARNLSWGGLLALWLTPLGALVFGSGALVSTLLLTGWQALFALFA